MKGLLDAFWRAAAYGLHPRVMLWSLLPMALVGVTAAALSWWYWGDAVLAVRGVLTDWALPAMVFGWLESLGAADLRGVLAPLIVVALVLPLLVVATLTLVAVTMTPVIVAIVARRRFPQMELREGASWWQGLAWSLACTVLALLALVASVPLWFVPPLVLIVPPLIWGWLGYRIFSFDALARHASASERRELMREHRLPLLTMGVISGYLGAAPALVWAFGIASLVLAPVLVLISVWLYTLVFAFSAAWFTHYCLATLQAMRLRADLAAATAVQLEAPPPAPQGPQRPDDADGRDTPPSPPGRGDGGAGAPP